LLLRQSRLFYYTLVVKQLWLKYKEGVMLRKRIHILLTAAMIAGLMAGCGSAGQSPSESGAAQGSTGTETAAESGGDSQNGTKAEDRSGQEPYTVRIVADGYGSEEACAEIGEAVSEITKAKFNTEVEIVRYDFSTYVDKVQTELASGEKIDLLGGVSQLPIPSAASQGQVLALNDLLESDGQDILADISSEDLASTSIDGQVYAVRNNKELGLGLGFACNTQMLESLGVDYSNIKTEADMEPILRAVKEKYPDCYPFASDSGAMGDYMYAIDWLGRDFGVLTDSFSDDTTVVNFYTSDEYYELCSRRYEWSQNGLIMPDASINTEQVTSLMGAGKAFCATTETKPGIESQWERNTGIDITIINIVPYYTTTSNLNNYWYIPYTSEQPERAMQVLNEMYSNPDVANLLIYGIEGKYYEFVEEEKGVIDYPEGITAEDLGWTVTAWHFPNELIAHKWVTDGPDIWEDTIAFNKDCHPSVAKGFVWDSTDVTNEVVACTTVLNKYKKGLETGDVDPDSVWEQMKQEFEEAGIRKILTEKQKQLDTWLAGRL
jgi:putative aldouronate transport system substrate-binding protein